MVLGSGEDDDCRKVVDTDEESDGTDEGSGTSSDDDVADAKRTAMKKFLQLTTATGVQQRGGGRPGAKSGLKPLWYDDYFTIADNPGEFVHVKVRDPHRQTVGGTAPLSKQVHPRDFGEPRSDPVRSLLVLRGWSLWRARVDGWANGRACRRRHFDEQQACLERDVQRLQCNLQAPCGLLGNVAANAAFMQVVPEVVARIQATGV